jgi:chemotaxis family two-component system response regulator Rcp1
MFDRTPWPLTRQNDQATTDDIHERTQKGRADTRAGEQLVSLNGADRPIEILLVEDNPADVRLTREVLENGRVATRLNVVQDGEEALAFIRREGEYAESPRPKLVLLDLNLPKKDGREVLQELKADPDLGRIPVIVLTTSAAETDIERSYALRANCVITKPMDLEEFFSVVRMIEGFWLTTARLPSD